MAVSNKVSVVSVPFLSLVRQVDPDFDYDKRHELEYDFSRRRFIADPAKRGAYNTNSNGTAPAVPAIVVIE